MRRLFGTDGIRGVAGQAPLDARTVFAFGCALGEWACRHPERRVLIGRDTRESGPALASLVAAGVREAGAEPLSAGVVTTPAVAFLTRSGPFSAGVMISASHNPWQDNGLKVFAHDGFKLPDAEELELEGRILEIRESIRGNPGGIPPEEDDSLARKYQEYVCSAGLPLAGAAVVLDCAHGAAFRLGPALFRALGARVVEMGCEPDGRNINEGCGALHVEALRQRVLGEGAAFGAAFDGDADRCILVSASGKVLDGDHILLVGAKAIRPRAVVATVMSNLGLERALAGHGIGLVRTAVGDRYVLEEMLRQDLPLGGEQSGHVIFRQFSTTGDGLLTAIRAAAIAREAGAGFDELTREFTAYPQRLVNVRFREKRPLEELASVQREIRETELEFGSAGRVLVRFSGTEPLARVMVEGPEAERVEYRARRIAAAIEAELGSAARQ
ncbi:MAG: phosphoglucosamine mutase [Bryobacteraceae bacterium]|nr:phosphoglucosamine mutase [Bryobacteraceae bacterium]